MHCQDYHPLEHGACVDVAAVAAFADRDGRDDYHDDRDGRDGRDCVHIWLLTLKLLWQKKKMKMLLMMMKLGLFARLGMWCEPVRSVRANVSKNGGVCVCVCV